MQRWQRYRRRKTAIPPPSLVRDELHWSNKLPAETGRKPLSALSGESEGPTPEAWEGEVGGAADRDIGPPHPALSPRPAGKGVELQAAVNPLQTVTSFLARPKEAQKQRWFIFHSCCREPCIGQP